MVYNCLKHIRHGKPVLKPGPYGISLLKPSPAMAYWNQAPPWYITAKTRPRHGISLLKPGPAMVNSNQTPPWYTETRPRLVISLLKPAAPPMLYHYWNQTSRGKSLLKPGTAMVCHCWNQASHGILLPKPGASRYITSETKHRHGMSLLKVIDVSGNS